MACLAPAKQREGTGRSQFGRSKREEMPMYRRYGEIHWGPGDAPESAATKVADRPRSSRRTASRRTAVSPFTPLPTIDLHGVKLHAVTERRAIEHILDELDAGNGG